MSNNENKQLCHGRLVVKDNNCIKCKTCNKFKKIIDFYQRKHGNYHECKECEKLRGKKWKALNKEKHLKYNRKYKDENREIVNLKNSIYKKSEKGKISNQLAKYRRRMIKKNLKSFTIQEWKLLLERAKNKCCICGVKFNKNNKPTKDHIIPLSKGGQNTIDNIQPLCYKCNLKKSNKIINLF